VFAETIQPKAQFLVASKLKEKKMAKQSFLKEYGPAIGTVLGVLVVAEGAVRTIDSQILKQTTDFNTQVSIVADKIAAVDKRLIKAEGALKAIGDNQSDPLKSIVRDLLAVAANARCALTTYVLRTFAPWRSGHIRTHLRHKRNILVT
jgi:hypothetical protein